MLHPEFRKEIIAQLSETEAENFFASYNRESALALRVNPLKKGSDKLIEGFIEEAVPWEPLGFYLRSGTKPGSSIAHTAGAFYLQEASAMASVAVLDPKPGERVLDLCAAPGGKSTQIAGRMQGSGVLVANEPDSKRAGILASNLERFGVKNACVLSEYPQRLLPYFKEYFDAVLVDAPCSGEGMFRRDPETIAQWNPAAPEGCAGRQAQILDAAAQLLRPGGRLVYSTCTFNRLEDEGSIENFLKRHPAFEAEDFALPGVGRSESGMLKLWPHRLRGDGHFCARLRKAGMSDTETQNPPVLFREKSPLLDQLQAEVCRLPGDFCIRRIGKYYYMLPAGLPDINGLKCVMPGVCLLRADKNYLEPQHALCMACETNDFMQLRTLNDEEALRYLSGETLPASGQGFMPALWHDLPLGWGKVSEGTFKNKLPKGLRKN